MAENDIQKNYIKTIKLDDGAEIPVKYPEDTTQEGCITVICGKNHSGKSYILKKISETLKKEERDYEAGELKCQGTNLRLKFSNSDAALLKPKQILSIDDPTSIKRRYEEIIDSKFKWQATKNIFTYELYFNQGKNIFQDCFNIFYNKFSTYYIQNLQQNFDKSFKNDFDEDLKKDFDKSFKKYFDEYLKKYFDEDLKKYFDEDLKKYFDKSFKKDFYEYFKKDFDEYLKKDFDEYLKKYFDEYLKKYFDEYLKKYFDEDLKKDFDEDLKKDFDEDILKIFPTLIKSVLIEEHDEFRQIVDGFHEYINNVNKLFITSDIPKNIYLCKQNDLLVKKFQEAVKGYLYFATAIDEPELPTFVIRSYDGNRTLKYTDWSDGQKTLFTSLLEINYIKPEIFLIDEIETHYHPEYITQLLQFLKASARQSIIVTHHPHVVFSRLVDNVIYIDTKDGEKQKAEKIITIEENSFDTYRAKREIHELNTDFDKIDSAYSLFDQKDHQILQLNSLFTGDDWNQPIGNDSELESEESPKDKLFGKIVNSGISEHLFLNFTEFITLLSHTKHEKNYLSPALVLQVLNECECNNYFEKINIKSDYDIQKNISFAKCIETIKKNALKVNQENNTFLVIKTTDTNYTLWRYELNRKSQSDDNSQASNTSQFYKRHPVQDLITESGCAWVLSGESSIQLYVKGEFVADYRAGEWKPRDFEYYKLKLEELANQHNLGENNKILIEAFKICLLSSKNKCGMTLAIELKEKGILELCDSNYVNNELDNWNNQKITDFDDNKIKLYLNSIAGDGAAILDRNGKTLAVNAIFQPKVETKIDKNELVKNGTRHLNSQKISKEVPQSIIFVVSTDGPITVFHKGKAEFRVL